MFALTTPIFEYWDHFRAVSEFRECRRIPDHARDLKPGSPNPHAHQQEMTPNNIHEYMTGAFPASEWQVSTYRAWPWEINDLARGRSFKMFFKIFALARRL